VLYTLRGRESQILQECGKSGTTVANLDTNRFLQFQIPLPPPAEQRRIVARLDALLGHLALARAELARVPRLAERNRQAALTQMLTDDNGKEWPFVQLETLITDGPTNGYSPRSGENPDGTLSLKLSATTRGVLDLSEQATKRLNEVISPSSKFWLRSGDILIQRANSLEYVGATAIYDGPEASYIYPDLMMRVRVKSAALGRWIWRYLNSATARQYFISNATGTAGNMPKINGSTVRGILIPMPPPESLDRGLARIDSAMARIGRAEAEAARAAGLVERLEQETLARAFRGEL
jgi:type I restriction enzyme S subunit